MKPIEAIKALEEMDAQIIDSKNRIFKRIADTIRNLVKDRNQQRDALRSAVLELERVDTVKDGHPLVSHSLMRNLRPLADTLWDDDSSYGLTPTSKIINQ